jgi:hypothetical protein
MMEEMTEQEEEKLSNIKKLIVGMAIGIVVVGIIVSGIALQISQKPSTSPYVEVKYGIIGWYHVYLESEACLVLNLAITNKGYGDGVIVNGYGFSLNIGNTSYNQTFNGVLIPESSSPSGFSLIASTLQSATLLNGRSETGTIIFEVPGQRINSTFTLQCPMSLPNSTAVNVKISES